MENINKYIKTKINEVRTSDRTFASLFDIVHNQDQRVFAEVENGLINQDISYNDIKDYIYHLASYYSNMIMDEKGKFVGIYMDNSINFVSTIWALLMIGYKPMLLNNRLPNEINNQIISLLGINSVIADKDVNLNAIILQNKAQNRFLDEAKKCDKYNLSTWENEIALSTTATTLNYKICIYTGEDIIYQVLNAESICKESKPMKTTYRGKIKQLMFLPLYHVFGLIACYFWFSVFGRIFVFLKNNSSDELLKTIKEHQVTHIFSVPLFWNTIVKEINKSIEKLPEKRQRQVKKGVNFSLKLQKAFPKFGRNVARCCFKEVINKTLGKSIVFCISGGGYINNDTMRFINAIGYPLYNGYGSTEQGITSVELRDNVKYRLLSLAGKPFESVEYQVHDDILYVKGLSSCSKIIYKDGKIEKVNHNGWFNTHDSAKMVGSYLQIKGRCDDVIVSSNGEKINPDMLEQDLHLSVPKRYSILDLDGISLVVEISIPTIEEKDQLLKEISKENTKIGFSHIYYTYNEIANANAIKVSRQNLKRLIENGSVKLYDISTLEECVKDSDLNQDVVLRLVDAFSDILAQKLTLSDINKHFTLDLGGSSIDYCSLLLKIENIFNIEIEEGINLTSISDFAKYISKNK